VILLSRVVRLAGLAEMNPSVIEGLYIEDFRFLLDFYNRINGGGEGEGHGPEVECPQCRHRFRPGRGGGPAPGGS
jgi:hypothetical protein